jgi:Cys-tRNA(Pro) deacylase
MKEPMGKEKVHQTQAIRQLKAQGVPFTLCPYRYEEKGGTEVAARALNVDEHRVVKTLVMETDKGDPLLVLMHGDRIISAKALARFLGVKKVTPCDTRSAHKHTGYSVGGISPFGTRKPLAVYMEASIADLPMIYINAGKRGLLAEMEPRDLIRALNPTPVEVATGPPGSF